jgi:GT2 family glycosyltransferase
MTGHVVVVLSWFGRDDTLPCVRSLVDGSPEATVLVVDNGSYDGTLEDVARAFPGVRTLQTGANLGFTGGMNAGLRWALDRGADTVTILYNVTVVPPGTMRRLGEVAATGCAVSPLVTYLDDPERVWFAAGAVAPETGLPHHGPSVPLPPVDPDGTRPTEVIAGACLTASAETWRRVGLLDDRYHLIFEDSDWSLRARALGVPLRVDTRSTVAHRVSASFDGPMSYLGLYYYVRNGLLFTRSHGAGAATTGRFLRRHVLPRVRVRTGDRRAAETGRNAVVVGFAATSWALRRFGAAPRPLAALAGRWTRDVSR